MEDVQSRNPILQIVNVSSGETQEVEKQGVVISSCWSPDNKQLVYEAGENVRVYNLEEKRSRLIAAGKYPTWSPDGNWIVFLNHDKYYAIHPSGAERHLLFKSWHSESGLFWSPDSRLVAYVSQARALEGGFLPSDVERYYLRVRRLEDNSEARITYALTPFSFQWVASTELFRAAQSNIGEPPAAQHRQAPD
jgi:Tol biopolymer transport system component